MRARHALKRQEQTSIDIGGIAAAGRRMPVAIGVDTSAAKHLPRLADGATGGGTPLARACSTRLSFNGVLIVILFNAARRRLGT